MANEIIGAVKLPLRALRKVLPIEGASAVIGTEANTKVRFKGEEYLITWKPVIYVEECAKLTELNDAYANADAQRQDGISRRNKADALRTAFNALTATPVNDD